MNPSIANNPKFNKLIISTGNILNVSSELGRKSDEELIDGLNLTLRSNESSSGAGNHVEIKETEGQVLRATQELTQKLTENDRPDISIGAKIFLNKNSSAFVEQAVSSMLQILNIKHVDNLVLAYHPNPINNAIPTTPTTTTTPASADSGSSIQWNSRSTESVNELKALWSSLEGFAQRQEISQLGISDLDIETLKELHEGAQVPPTIAQINLSSCCVVPPALREFCTRHDIQLLTHGDPEMLLCSADPSILPGYEVDWTLRYQVHVRCRGVLTAKGYIIGASRLSSA